jgi:hypothetical protein
LQIPFGFFGIRKKLIASRKEGIILLLNKSRKTRLKNARFIPFGKSKYGF